MCVTSAGCGSTGPDSPNPARVAKIRAIAHKRGGLLAQIEADIVDDSRLRAQVGLNTVGAIIELHNVNDTTFPFEGRLWQSAGLPGPTRSGSTLEAVSHPIADDWVLDEAEALLDMDGRRERLEQVVADLQSGKIQPVGHAAARVRIEKRIQKRHTQ
jgi:hypothetical protein